MTITAGETIERWHVARAALITTIETVPPPKRGLNLPVLRAATEAASAYNEMIRSRFFGGDVIDITASALLTAIQRQM